jgi:hypothetical protein
MEKAFGGRKISGIPAAKNLQHLLTTTSAKVKTSNQKVLPLNNLVYFSCSSEW